MGTLASAIAQLENTNPAYNNPGAITDYAQGQTGETFGAGIPIYSSFSAGESAFETKIANIYNGTSKVYNTNMTLDQFGDVYAPNQGYGAGLAGVLGVPSSTTIGSIPSGVGGSQSIVGGAQVPNSYSVAGTIKNTLNPTAGWLAQVESWLSSQAHDAVVIVVGIILIAAGVFAFKQTQNVVETATRVGRRVAEVAG